MGAYTIVKCVSLFSLSLFFPLSPLLANDAPPAVEVAQCQSLGLEDPPEPCSAAHCLHIQGLCHEVVQTTAALNNQVGKALDLFLGPHRAPELNKNLCKNEEKLKELDAAFQAMEDLHSQSLVAQEGLKGPAQETPHQCPHIKKASAVVHQSFEDNEYDPTTYRTLLSICKRSYLVPVETWGI